MMPVLDELTAKYEGRLHVEFINVREDPERASEFGVRTIPTQVFIDASGEELYRHLGFISTEDILAKWAELGVDLGTDSALGASE